MHDYKLVILSVYHFELRATQSFQAQSNSGIAVREPIFPILLFSGMRNDSHEARVKRHFSPYSDEFLNLQECPKTDSLSWSEGSKTFSW